MSERTETECEQVVEDSISYGPSVTIGLKAIVVYSPNLSFVWNNFVRFFLFYLAAIFCRNNCNEINWMLLPFSDPCVQQPSSRTTFGCGSNIFMTLSSDMRSFFSFSEADSLRVFTATVVVPFFPSMFRASHFQTWPKQPSPKMP